MEINRIPYDQCPTRITGNYFNINSNLKQKTFDYVDPFPYGNTRAKKGEKTCNELALKLGVKKSGLHSMATRMFGHSGNLTPEQYKQLEEKALDKKQ